MKVYVFAKALGGGLRGSVDRTLLWVLAGQLPPVQFYSVLNQLSSDAQIKALISPFFTHEDLPGYQPGFTPVLHAAYHGHLSIIKTLFIEYGVDPLQVIVAQGRHWHAANVALSQGHFEVFLLCILFSKAKQAIQQFKFTRNVTIQVLFRYLDQQDQSQRVVSGLLMPVTQLIIYLSHPLDVQQFIAAIDLKEDSMVPFWQDIKNFALSQLAQPNVSFTAFDTGQLVQQLNCGIQDNMARLLIKDTCTQPKQLPRSQSLDALKAKPDIGSQASNTSAALTYYVDTFSASFVGCYLDAVRSLDLSNFETSGRSALKSIENNLNELEGLSAKAVGALAGLAGGFMDAKVAHTIKQAGNFLIIADGPAEVLVPRSEAESDEAFVMRVKLARIDQIAKRLARKIFAYHPQLNYLSPNALSKRIQVQINHICQFIGSKRFNPSAVGHQVGEIDYLVNTIFQYGWLHQDQLSPGWLAKRSKPTAKHLAHGYYSRSVSGHTEYWLPMRHKQVSHFVVAPKLIDLSQWVRVNFETVSCLIRQNLIKQTFLGIKLHLKHQYDVRLFMRARFYRIRVFLETFLQKFFMSDLWAPEMLDASEIRQKLIHILHLNMVKLIVPKLQKACYFFGNQLKIDRMVLRANHPWYLHMLTAVESHVEVAVFIKPDAHILTVIQQSSRKNSALVVPMLPSISAAKP